MPHDDDNGWAFDKLWGFLYFLGHGGKIESTAILARKICLVHELGDKKFPRHLIVGMFDKEEEMGPLKSALPASFKCAIVFG